MSTQPNSCINCGQEGKGHFCSNCGQKLKAESITWRYVSSEFLDRWFGVDTKFGRTVIDLFKSPGQVIKTYLSGNTIKYIGPLGYYIVMSALLILLFEVLGISIDKFLMGNNEAMGMDMENQSAKQQEILQIVYQWMAENFRYIGGLMVPFLALSGKMFYRKTTYLHHVITATFFQSHTYWFSLTMIAIYKVSGYNLTGITMIASILFMMIAYMLAFSPTKKFKGLIKGLLIWLVGYFMMLAVAMVVGTTFIIIFYV